MITKIIEVEDPHKSAWGKFMVGRFTGEWSLPSVIDPGVQKLLSRLGWGLDHFLIVDLSVGHGAIFHRKGYVWADIDEHGIYFCWMFPAFLVWIRTQDLRDLGALPDKVVLEELRRPIPQTAGVENAGNEPGIGGSNPQA